MKKQQICLWSCWKSCCHAFTSPSCSLSEKSNLPIFCKCGEPWKSKGDLLIQIWLYLFIVLLSINSQLFVNNILSRIFYFISFPSANIKLDLFQLPVQSVPITTNIESLNPIHAEVYSIPHYVIKFVTDLRQVGSFLLVLRFPPTIKLTTTI